MNPRLRRPLVRIGAMAHKETLHVLRDPRTLYLALVMPVVMLFLFGYGITTDLERTPRRLRSGPQRGLARWSAPSPRAVSWPWPATPPPRTRTGSSAAARPPRCW